MARPRNAVTPPEATEPAPLPIAGEDDERSTDPSPDTVEPEFAGRPSAQGAERPPKPAPVFEGRKSRSAFVEGRQVKSATQVDDTIRIKANEHPNFILTHDPARWGYYPQVGKILPDFGKIRLVPGIGRVDARGRPDAALVDAHKAGRTVIYDRDIRGGYLREYDMLGGIGFLCRWERVKVSGRSVKIEIDWQAFEDFVGDLLESGTIEPPDEGTIHNLRDAAKNMIAMSEPRKERPSVAAEIAMYERQVVECDGFYAAA